MRDTRLSRLLLRMVAAATLAVIWASPSRADMLFSKSGIDDNSKTISASALFHVNSATHNLIVTVTNTTPYTSGWTIDRTDLLTALFFDITGTPGLSFRSAYLAGGSSFVQGSPPPATTNLLVTSPVGSTFQDGWEYKTGNSVSSQLSSDHYGVGTAGLDIFDGSVVGKGQKNSDFALAPANYPGGHANNSNVNSEVLVVNSLVFTFGGLPSTFDETKLKNVRFQFGTDLDDPSISVTTGTHQHPFDPAVPEPSTLAIAGVGALALAGYGVRRRLRR